MGKRCKSVEIIKTENNTKTVVIEAKYLKSLKMKKLTTLLFILLNLVAQATHNRAGEITYKQLSDYTFEITVITVTNTKPTSNGTMPADRPELAIKWGDNTYSEVKRNKYVDLPDYYRRNTYISKHTYPGPGTYEIIVEDPNRNEGVENIKNSVTVVFSIKTILQINPLVGLNNTPVLLNPPIDKAAVNQRFIHNPAAFDPDGDSISYRLTVCTGENGKPIEGYEFPKSSKKPIYIDAITGDLVWDSPIKKGIFNVAFFIEEWRKGIKIGQITRDMQIEVVDAKNKPPVIDSILPKCVIAGDTLKFSVSAKDDANEQIILSATGGTFEMDKPATFVSDTAKGMVKGNFVWATSCKHIRKSPYLVIFKATDDNKQIKLVDQKAALITVIAPPPKKLTAKGSDNNIRLNWDTYKCTNAKGFYIYRSHTNYGFVPDSCEVGVPSYTNYKKIATINDKNINTFVDDDNGKGLKQGFRYCYMISAYFADKAESKASNEACEELKRGIPIITNVSVSKYDKEKGEMYVAWSKPKNFDTGKYPPPHQYIVKRSNGIANENFQIVATLPSLNDTVFYDKNINTSEQTYLYSIEIHNDNGITTPPMKASSMFPHITSSDRTLQIDMQQKVPWENYRYIIYRQNKETLSFDSINYSQTISYKDKGLINNKKYCYRIKSIGGYQLDGIIKPIINFSHQNCGIPTDTTPPLPPILNVNSDCKSFINLLSWVNQSPISEIKQYKIYFSASENQKLNVIDSILYPDSLHYGHILTDYPSGCYALTALDMNGNESKISNLVCVDNCNYYELPNVFSPNNDGINDVFVPITPKFIIDRFIEKANIKIYSRWGNLVFETDNPHINWSGKNKQSNHLVTPGVYYYVCDLKEKRISGSEERNIVGFIHVFHQDEQLKENNKE